MHDHGGSSGAFTALTGALTEAVPSPAGSRDTVRAAGTSVGFGPHTSTTFAISRPTAVSVHAYSPPLSTMNFYDGEDHRIVRTRSLVTGDPEPALPSAS